MGWDNFTPKYADEDSKSEWNSNQEVIKRMNETLVRVNMSKHAGNVTAAIDFLRDYYLDMCGSLTKDEDAIWDDITNLKLMNNPLPDDATGGAMNQGMILRKIDEVDRNLRKLAKKHGLHISDKEDTSGL